jgi:hypothetical protein
VVDFPSGRDTAFVLSEQQARAMVVKAKEEWGADADDPSTLRRTVIRLYMGGHNQRSGQGRRAPVGAFQIRWNAPTSGQATIDRVEWNPALGGSDGEVCQVIDALAGWRLSR